MAKFSLQALADEINNDPQAIGLKEAGGEWKGDQAIADLLNDPANGATITRLRVTPNELKSSFDLAEFVALSDGQRDYLQCLLSGDETVDANEPTVFAALTTLFGPASATRANLLVKIQRPGSRAEVLWGEGVQISARDVGAAANL